MPTLYKPGQIVKNYKIVELLNQGNFANAYKAEDSRTGGLIFLKQYIDPTPALGKIYEQFVQHQQLVKNILSRLDVVERNFEFFEFNNCYFQAKEFMDGFDLASALMDTKNPLTDEQRFLIATVFMYAIRKLHRAGIVHTDLKPQQIYLKSNPAIALQYQVKIVDFDFCRIPGQSDPIYISTTPFYSSPEHITNQPLEFGSDIFTCGIILTEILGGQHPILGEDQEAYEKNVLAYQVIQLKDLNPAISSALSDIVYRMLNPDINKRPNAEEVHRQLLTEVNRMRVERSTTETIEDKETSKENEGAIIEPEVKEKNVAIRVQFLHPVVRYPFSVHKTSVLGKNNFRIYGEHFRELANEQFKIIKSSDGWKIMGLPAKNPTLFNGIDCTNKQLELEDGGEIQIGEFKITVQFIFNN